jgi:tRNA dimethylallyltransferase
VKSSPERLQVKSSSILQTTSDPFDSIIFLFGPTGVGKTDLLTNLDPSRFAVVNADSIQVYRHLDIGSAKASKELQSRIEHHLIDIREPNTQFTVADFIEEADTAIRSIASRGKVPIITGGTAFYFKHFLYGLSEAPASDEATRARVQALIDEKGRAWAHAYLCEVDPASGSRIHINDSYRISRALEVWQQSGRPLSSFDLPTTARRGMKPLIIALMREQEELHRRIRERVDQMFREGLEDEIRRLVAMGAQRSWPALVGIGYREFFTALATGEYTRTMVGEEIVRNSRAYAKRQLTFFKSFADAQWFNASQTDAITATIESYVCR